VVQVSGLRPPGRVPVAQRPGGFTLVELLAAVAALAMGLILAIQLARDVRGRSAERLTRSVLRAVEQALTADPALAGELATAVPLVAPAAEGAWLPAARENNRAVVRILRQRAPAAVFSDLPLSVWDGTSLRDAWGTPIIFVAPGAPVPGAASRKRGFFVSAGPDRLFDTLLDNLNSYERG
jgi:prepilin-type N-terminal cleavage/methylation domain-containing protein